MKRYYLLIIITLCPFIGYAQQWAEHNVKGDEAMSQRDYRDAQMWYEEGVVFCDPYSINQLTTIWLENEELRPSMRSLMTKCLNCLHVRATENDTIAMSKLVVYYTEGIGTAKSENLAAYWKVQLETGHQHATTINEPAKTIKPRQPMRLFIGYALSVESPYGITIGGVQDRLGWYARFRTNFSFVDYTYECDEASNVLPAPDNASTRYNREKKDKINSYSATAGFVWRATNGLYASVGMGYGERALVCPFITRDYTTGDEQEIGCYNIDASHKGLVAEVDLMYRLGNFFISAGVNTINFKYADLNAGLGYFF